MSPAAYANDQFLRACLRQPTDHTPVWLMRQAGRYLPEYNATRTRAGSFMGLATSPDFATEVTLQPLDRYPLDAAILFSDILTVPDAMGLGLSFAAGEGPRFAKMVREEGDVAALQVPDLDKLRYVFDAVASIRKALTLPDGRSRVPLIGFSGSPWTLACYMVEGAGSDDYRQVKSLMYRRPDLMHRVLEVNAQAVTSYLNAQIEAGAQAVMVFDSWGGVWPTVLSRPSAWPTRAASWRASSESMGASASPASCSPRVVGSGWKASLPAALMWWAWTGPPTWAVPAPAWVIRWPCRATSTPWCCSGARLPCAPRCAAPWTASVRRAGRMANGAGMC